MTIPTLTSVEKSIDEKLKRAFITSDQEKGEDIIVSWLIRYSTVTCVIALGTGTARR